MTEPAGKRILDVACGDGQLGAELRKAGAAEVVGLDPCARALTRSRLTAVFTQDPDAAPVLPYPDGYFDVVLVEDVSRLLVPGPTLQHLRRWLADQGRLVCVVMNAGHEAALAGLIVEGRLSPNAGARAMTPSAALDAMTAAGYRVEDGLTLVRALVAGRPAGQGRRQPPAFQDPWRGSKPVKVLLAPDVRADPQWVAKAEAVGKGLEGNAEVTLGIALPAQMLESPPAPLRQAMEGLRLDVLLTEAPADAAGWQRMAAGASTVVAPPPERLPLARLVGVDVQGAG
jgi:SAM-dependent methyltransferase